MDKNKLLRDLKADYDSAYNSKSTIEDKIVKWKKFYNAEPLGNEVDGKSKYVSKDIKKLLKWQLPNILEPFVNTPEIVRCQGTTAETVKTAKKKEKLLNYQFCRDFDRYNFMRNVIKLMQKEDTVVIRVGWDIKTKKEIQIQQVQMPDGSIQQIEQEIEVPVVNKPTAKICKLENIFIDPSATEDEPEFVIHKYKTTLSNLKSNIPYFNKDAINSLYDKINLTNDSDEGALESQRESEYTDNGQDTDFETTDVSRKKVDVYEYWGKYDINGDGIAEDIVCCWVDNTIIKLEDNPFPDNKIPFIIANYEPEPFMVYGENSAVEDLVDNSKLQTILTRGMIENIASANIGQTGFLKGILDPINKKRYIAGQRFEFNEPLNAGSLYQANYNQLTNTPMQMLQMISDDSQMLSGIVKNTLGQSERGLSASQTNNIASATQRRMLDLVRNIAYNVVKPLLKKWLVYSSEYLSNKEIFYITGEESFVIDKQDLDGDVHMEMQISTQAIDDEKSKQLAFLLQTSQQSQDPKITKMLYVKLLKLNKMFEEAKELETYEPQPNKEEQYANQLELKQLEAKIMDLQVKTMENKADIQLKLAKAEEIKSKKDINDLEYIKDAKGVEHSRELDKIALTQMHNNMKGVNQ